MQGWRWASFGLFATAGILFLVNAILMFVGSDAAFGAVGGIYGLAWACLALGLAAFAADHAMTDARA